MRGIGRLRQRLGTGSARSGRSLPIADEDRDYLTSLYDESVPLPDGAAAFLVPDNPRLVEIRRAYAALDLPVLTPSRWHERAVESFLDLRWFRGETLFMWHYRELRRASELKYFIFARYVRDRDTLGLLDQLDEDGAFGCWTFSYPGWGRVSRDLLQSINEISFLERALEISRREHLTVFDIGAGYGRLAHRMSGALTNLEDYCCVDAIAEATFLSGWYLEHRGCAPPARAARLDRLDDELQPGAFDLALNINSFSECPLDAVQWWIALLERLQVPHLLLVPNEPDQLLCTERDGTRRDFRPALEAAGYKLQHSEPVIDDPAVRELLPLDDRFYLFGLG